MYWKSRCFDLWFWQDNTGFDKPDFHWLSQSAILIILLSLQEIIWHEILFEILQGSP
jgi:hypothetical protein